MIIHTLHKIILILILLIIPISLSSQIAKKKTYAPIQSKLDTLSYYTWSTPTHFNDCIGISECPVFAWKITRDRYPTDGSYIFRIWMKSEGYRKGIWRSIYLNGVSIEVDKYILTDPFWLVFREEYTHDYYLTFHTKNYTPGINLYWSQIVLY